MHYSSHEVLESTGYGVEKLIVDSEFDEGLAALSVEVARGYFKKIKIVPAETALNSPELNFRPDHELHLVYAILSSKHPYRKALKEGQRSVRPPIQIYGKNAKNEERSIFLSRAK